MTGYATAVKQPSRRHSRSEWWLLGTGITGAVLMLIVIGLLVRANDIPPIPIPSPSPLPSPNAFDVFLRAASLTTGEAGEMTMGIRPEPSPTERAAMLKRNRMALDIFRTAFDYPYQNPPARTYRSPFTHLASFAELSQTAVWEAKDLAERGQLAAATETCLDLMRFGLAIPQGGSVRHLIADLNIEEDGREILWDLKNVLPASVVRTAARELYQLDSQRVSYAAILEELKWSALSATIELYRTGQLHHALNNAGSTAQSAQRAPWWESVTTSLSLAPVPPRQVIAGMTAYLDAQIDRARQPYHPASATIPFPNDPVNRLMVTMDYHGIQILIRDTEAQHRLLTLALALRAFRLEKGDYPASLDPLVSSGYLPAIPRDPFTNGLPLRYRRLSANQYLLYSVGPDAHDDDGNPITIKEKPAPSPLRAGMTGDFVVGQNIP